MSLYSVSVTWHPFSLASSTFWVPCPLWATCRFVYIQRVFLSLGQRTIQPRVKACKPWAHGGYSGQRPNLRSQDTLTTIIRAAILRRKKGMWTKGWNSKFLYMFSWTIETSLAEGSWSCFLLQKIGISVAPF